MREPRNGPASLRETHRSVLSSGLRQRFALFVALLGMFQGPHASGGYSVALRHGPGPQQWYYANVLLDPIMGQQFSVQLYQIQTRELDSLHHSILPHLTVRLSQLSVMSQQLPKFRIGAQAIQFIEHG